MRLLTVQQMRQAEETAAKQGLSYLRMMENAGSAAANWMMKGFPAETKGTTVFLCGAGNNGGDGFVAARRMAEQGRSVGVILACGHPTSPTAAQMLERLSGFSVPVVEAKTQSSFARQLIAESTLVPWSTSLYTEGDWGKTKSLVPLMCVSLNALIWWTFSNPPSSTAMLMPLPL